MNLLAAEPVLPLSWSQSSQFKALTFDSVKLMPSCSQWVAFANVPAETAPPELVQRLFQRFGQQPFALRGCNPRWLELLQPWGGQALITGREALLDLRGNHLQKKSLRELARRGRRHGEVSEGHLPTVSAEVQALLQRVQSHYLKPLSYLYRTGIPASERFWVLQGERTWGLISLVPTGPYSWHTELLVRDPEAPVGVMEALIAHIFQQLAAEQALFWSLGEVPFWPPVNDPHVKSLSLQWIGREINFAYSASGLLQFKRKFQPLWRPVMLYGWPRLSWQTLAGMFWYSRCSALVLQALRKKASALFPMAELVEARGQGAE